MAKFIWQLLILILGFYFVGCESHKTEDRINKIRENGDKVLYHTTNKSEDSILYKTKDGIFLWRTSDKEPKNILSGVDTVRIKSFFYSPEINDIKKDSRVSLKQAKDHNDEGSIEGKGMKALTDLSNTNISITWPWIIIDNSYIFHVSDPKTIIEIRGLKNKDISVKSRGNNDLVVSRNIHRSELPGYYDYVPTKIPREAWTNVPQYYYGGRSWLDALNFISQLQLYDDPEEGLKKLAWDNEIPMEFQQTITYNSKNKTAEISYRWGSYSIPENGFNSSSLLPTYKSIEDELEQKFDKWKNDVENNMLSIMKGKAVNSWEIKALYSNNPYLAAQKFPVNKWYYINVYATRVRPSNYDFRFEISCDIPESTILLSNVSKFTSIEYPADLLVYAKLEGYIPDEYGYNRLFFSDAAVFDAIKPKEY